MHKDMLSLEEVAQRLIRAIYAQRVAEAAVELLGMEEGQVCEEGRQLARSALSACQSISAHAREEREALLSTFAESGIEAAAIPDKADQEQLQVHSFSIRLKPGDVARAIELSQVHGFPKPVPYTGGSWACFLRVQHQALLIRTDEVTMRLRLVWGGEGRSRLSRRLRSVHPTGADFDLVELPTSLWPLYYLVRPGRILMRKLLRRPPLNSPWPFLGTPLGLIEELLTIAAVTGEDHVVDLGCGDGRILVEAARQRGCRCLGIENDPGLVALARERITAASLEDRVSVVLGDAAQHPLEEASVVFLFLPMPIIPGIIEALKRQLSTGARILVHEQAPLDPALRPDASLPVFTDSGITVAHLWTV